MRFGLFSPVVIRLPDAHGAWEVDAGPADLAAIAEHADALGYHHMTCSEHVGVPRGLAAERGATYWDSLATLGFLAARTRRLRLATNVVVLGYHHPLALAKSYGTLDRLSGGRVVLGVGVGSMREEFDLLGVSFPDRGARADDSLRALRAAWGRPVPEYSGEFYSFSDFVVDPHAVRTDVPIWVGGRTRRSLRRAVGLGDGWVPFGLSDAEIRELLREFELPQGFDVVLQPPELDPSGDPDTTRWRIDASVAAGATVVNVKFTARSRAHLLDQMHALTELYPEAAWTGGES